MADEEPQRSQGVNLEDVEDVLEELSYPVSASELADRYGDRTIERTNAEPIALDELLEPLEDEQTFESADDVHQMLMSLMPDESVGREGYSDRGGSTPDDPGNGADDESV